VIDLQVRMDESPEGSLRTSLVSRLQRPVHRPLALLLTGISNQSIGSQQALN